MRLLGEQKTVWILSDDSQDLGSVVAEPEDRAIRVIRISTLRGFRRAVAELQPDIILCRSSWLGGIGASMIEWLQGKYPEILTVVLGEWDDLDYILDALNKLITLRQETYLNEVDAPPLAEEAAVVDEPQKDRLRHLISENLERQYPGITEVRSDDRGFLILDDRQPV